ncbi:S-adenosyl-L-methionine-dependent methyltransferase [Clavulina sp. PMI_390]|nr:S-adenosyl-L-methionine-dependent methyltransferase [Clavulina sp. PMI_390]
MSVFETDDWSDDEEAESSSKQATPQSEIERLKAELEAKSAQVVMLQSRVQDLLEDPPSAGPAPRDDDTHYFQSYGYQDIHNIMLRDSVRTMSYAKFILSNPAVFRDKLVMDVGCGTGILSMFAARAGAKHVFAIDASDIALKARQNIKDSELDEFITVIQGKVEDIKLPAPYDDPSLRVDVIVSEWMGYALLYESMLDSVLVARDRFLKPLGSAEGSGIMAPSQCKMVMALVEATELWKEKVSFWDDVYGFKMTAMADEPFADAMIDNLPSDSIVSNLVTVKDLPTQRITVKELDFSSPFSFTVPRSKERSTIHGFVLYFDTYFAPNGEDVPVDSMPTISDPAGQGIEGDILPIGRLKRRKSLREDTKPPVEVSFSTGPQSYGTHWKQAIFLLKEPFRAIEGTTVSGTFHLKKSETNSRELDVEIHYSVSHTGLTSSPMKFQTYKVR